jgi:hypothetical protein
MDTLDTIQELIKSCELPLAAEDAKQLAKELYDAALVWMQEPPSNARRVLKKAKTRILRSFKARLRAGISSHQCVNEIPTAKMAARETAPPILSYAGQVKSLNKYGLSSVNSAHVNVFYASKGTSKAPVEYSLFYDRSPGSRRSLKNAVKIKIGVRAMAEGVRDTETISVLKTGLQPKNLRFLDKQPSYRIERHLYKTADSPVLSSGA